MKSIMSPALSSKPVIFRGFSISKILLFIFAVLASALMMISVVKAASVNVTIDISEQRMAVNILGQQKHYWPVSTGRGRYGTPTGTFRPKRLERQWYSRKYNWAPMPYSIFYYGGYAIHGTTEVHRLGRTASHGCVRLHPDNARVLYNLVRKHGMAATLIRIKQ